MIIYTDGACSGNPGPMGIGFVIFDGDKIIYKESRAIGNGTNNTAEYTAVVEAVEKAISLGAKSILVRSDSQLLVRQLNGKYRIRQPHLRRLKAELEGMLEEDMEVIFEHISRELNTIADKLSKDALKGILK